MSEQSWLCPLPQSFVSRALPCHLSPDAARAALRSPTRSLISPSEGRGWDIPIARESRLPVSPSPEQTVDRSRGECGYRFGVSGRTSRSLKLVIPCALRLRHRLIREDDADLRSGPWRGDSKKRGYPSSALNMTEHDPASGNGCS